MELRYHKLLGVAKTKFILIKNFKNKKKSFIPSQSPNSNPQEFTKERKYRTLSPEGKRVRNCRGPQPGMPEPLFFSMACISSSLADAPCPSLPTELSNRLSQDHGLELSYKPIQIQHQLGHLQHAHSHGGIIILTFPNKKMQAQAGGVMCLVSSRAQIQTPAWMATRPLPHPLSITAFLPSTSPLIILSQPRTFRTNTWTTNWCLPGVNPHIPQTSHTPSNCRFPSEPVLACYKWQMIQGEWLLGSQQGHLTQKCFLKHSAFWWLNFFFNFLSHEIKRCLLLGRKVMTNLDSILKGRDITLSTKFCLVKPMVFPVVIYGCESWTIK